MPKPVARVILPRGGRAYSREDHRAESKRPEAAEEAPTPEGEDSASTGDQDASGLDGDSASQIARAVLRVQASREEEGEDGERID